MDISEHELALSKLRDEIKKGNGDKEIEKKTLNEMESLITYISIVSEGDDKKKEKKRLELLENWAVLGGVHPDNKNDKGDAIKKKAEKKNPFFEKLYDVEKLYIYVDSIKKTTDRELSRMEAGLPKEVVTKTKEERLLNLKRQAEKLEAELKLEKLGAKGKRTVAFNNVSSGNDKTTQSVEGLERLSTLVHHISKDLKISELDLIKSLALHLKKGEISRNYNYYRFLEINKGIKLTASANDLIKSFSDGKVPAGFSESPAKIKSEIRAELKAAQETKAWIEQLESTSRNSIILF